MASVSSRTRNGAHRIKQYKSRIIDVDSIKSKRENEEITLRKERREKQYAKRRNIMSYEEPSPKEEDDKSHLKEEFDKLHIKDDTDEINENCPLDKLVKIVRTDEGEKRLKAVQALRRLLSTAKPPINEIIETGVVPFLVKFINREEPESLQMESAWALTNIASGTSEQTGVVVKEGAVPRLVQLLEAPNTMIKEQVVWALGNIIGDSPKYRDMVVDYGIIPALIELMNNEQETVAVKRQGAWALSNICRFKADPLPLATVKQVLPIFSQGLQKKDDTIVKDLCWGVSYLTDDCSAVVMTAILKSGILEHIIQLSDTSYSKEIIHPSVRTIGNVTTSNDEHTQVIIDCQGLPKLKALINYGVESIRREACWAISNITAGSYEQKQAVIDANIIPLLLDIISHNESEKLQKEAIWGISNLTEAASVDHISYLVGLGGLQTLSKAVNVADEQIICVVLDGIIGILEAGDRIASRDDTCNPFALMMIETDMADNIISLPNVYDEAEEVKTKARKIEESYINVVRDYQEKKNNEEVFVRNINEK